MDSPWHEATEVRALLTLMGSAVQRAMGGDGRVAVFVWDRIALELLEAGSGGERPAIRHNRLLIWLRDNPDRVSALRRGDAIPMTADRDETEYRPGNLLLPMTSQSGLEGVLCVTHENPLAEPALTELRHWCQLGALVLTCFREREAERSALTSALHAMGTPLVAARGYTKMVLDDPAGTISDTQREYLSTVLENVELIVRVVSELRRAGANA